MASRSSKNASWESGVWQLVSWEKGYWTSAPETPTEEAELCGDGDWASVFKDHRAIATWFRVVGYASSKRKEI